MATAWGITKSRDDGNMIELAWNIKNCGRPRAFLGVEGEFENTKGCQP